MADLYLLACIFAMPYLLACMMRKAAKDQFPWAECLIMALLGVGLYIMVIWISSL